MNRYLNCGCGEKYVVADEWINIDFNSRNKNVRRVNLLGTLPFKDGSIDAVFNSCMLEHFTKEQGEKFVAECYRILKLGGVLRIVVPDLENICEEYLRVLHECRNQSDSKSKYDYIIIEMIDQMTRTCPGGEMLRYWNSEDKDEAYILERTGYPKAAKKESLIEKLKNMHCYTGYIDRKMQKILERFSLFRKYYLGKFILSGEVHKWMYDAYSLGTLLEEKGFTNVRTAKYNESRIENWKRYKLEVTEDGKEYKPNCLYMEAVK